MKYHYIEVKTNSVVSPPYKTFLGSTIHGALIKSLEHIDIEVFQKFYKKNNTSYKYYRLDIPQEPKNFDFGLYLFDSNLPILITILTEIKKFLSSNSLTTHKYVFEESDIFVNGKKIVFDAKNKLVPFDALSRGIDDEQNTPDKNIAITLIHPCFITDGNGHKRYKRYITLKDIVLSAYKRKYFYQNGTTIYRLDEIKELMGEKDALLKDDYDIRYIYLHYKKYDRQKIEHQLEGMVGKIVIDGVNNTLYHALKLAETVGIGKSTTLGLGKIKIEVLSENIV